MHPRRSPPATRCALWAAVAALVGLAACGAPAPDAPAGLRFTASVLPQARSGERLERHLPVAGSAGGPYLVRVLAGRLPPGVELDSARLVLQGVPLHHGFFEFSLEIVDTGAEVFQRAVGRLSWNVVRGDVTLVEVLLEGEPALRWPSPAEAGAWPAMPPLVFNDYAVVEWVIAGGDGPYRLEVVDEPNVAGDGGLPLGLSIPPSSTAVVGAPVALAPKGGSFLVTFQAVDARGRRGRQTVEWQIEAPPVHLLTTQLPRAQAGAPYDADLERVGGIPPLAFELVQAGLPDGYVAVRAPLEGDVVYADGEPVKVRPPEALVRVAASDYPGPDEEGPAYDALRPGVPPEGLWLDGARGQVGGMPRRRGGFVLHVHVASALLPQAYGQHDWKTLHLDVGPASPLRPDPSFTLEGVFAAGPPHARLPPAERTVPYDPDHERHPEPGLALRASGGVPYDGWSDAPHARERRPRVEPDPYAWTLVGDVTSSGGPDAFPGMELDPLRGLWWAPDPEALVPRGQRLLTLEVSDAALPRSTAQCVRERVRFEVGPDQVWVTHSETSFAGTSSANLLHNDRALTLRVMEPYTAGPVLRPPDVVRDMVSGAVLPASLSPGRSLADLLSHLDLLRVSVNPTGWWDDVHGLCARGARPFQHGDRNAYVSYYGIHYNGSIRTSSSRTGCQPSVSAVRLPACRCERVRHDPASGVYTSGGKLYVFDRADAFGLFVLREDAKIDVLCAFPKDTYRAFGDNWNQPWSAEGGHSLVNLPQMAVSPDGRFGACKLKPSYDPLDGADRTPLVLVCLTGERLAAWGGRAWRLVASGSDGTSARGEIVFASSLTLTNRHLYYLLGSGDRDQLAWRDHHVYRYEVLSGEAAGSLLAPGSDEAWTNDVGRPLQTPFQRYADAFTQGENRPHPQMVARHGYNATEVSLAPHPFRVSADGTSCAILASAAPASNTGSAVLRHHVWLDRDGVLLRLSRAPRHTAQGGGRGIALRDGPEVHPMAYWGSRTGPTSGFEVRDDGLAVAVVVSRDGSWTGAAHPSDEADGLVREDVVVFRPLDGRSWAAGVLEAQVTGSEDPEVAPVFASDSAWRFGALAFTREGDGLVFWAGCSAARPRGTSGSSPTGAARAKTLVGSLYGYDLDRARVVGLLSPQEGGHLDGAGALYDATHPVTGPDAAWSARAGVVKPVGGFLSPSGRFLYVVTSGALSSSRSSDHALLAVNLRSLDAARALHGHPDGRAFAVEGMPPRRGFVPKYAGPESYLGIGSAAYDTLPPAFYGHRAPGGATGAGLQVASATGERVFFVTHRQRTGPTGVGGGETAERAGGPLWPTTSGDYGYVDGHVCLLDVERGGPIRRLTGAELGPDDGGSSAGSLRPVTYLEAAPRGNAVAFVYGQGGTVACYRERLAVVSGIELDPDTGELLEGLSFWTWAPSPGRCGSAMSFDERGARLYFARGDATDERSKRLFSVSVPSPPARAPHDLGVSTSRWNVLHAGR